MSSNRFRRTLAVATFAGTLAAAATLFTPGIAGAVTTMGGNAGGDPVPELCFIKKNGHTECIKGDAIDIYIGFIQNCSPVGCIFPL